MMASIRYFGIKEYNSFQKDLISSLESALDEKPTLFSKGLSDSQKRKLSLFISELKQVSPIPEETKFDDFQSRVVEFKTQLQFVAFKAYIDIYIDERSKGKTGTNKGKLLEKIEEIYQAITKKSGIDFLLSSTEHGKEQIDSRILSSAGRDKGFDTDHERELVTHVLIRAIQEGIYNGNQQVFTNCIKAIVRMEYHALFQWNTEIEKLEKKEPSLNLTILKFDKLAPKNEEAITKMFDVIRKDDKLKMAILKLFEKPEHKHDKKI